MNTITNIIGALGMVLLMTSYGCHASDAQTRAQSDSWVDHTDPTGFAIRYPQGWAAEGAKDGHVLAHSADRSVFAVAQPFKAPDGGSSAAWIGPLVKHMNTLFPNADIVRSEQVSTQPDEVIAKVAYSANGRAGQANVLCRIADGAGVFFAIAAPSDLFAAKKPTLIKVLRSLCAADASEAQHAPKSVSENGPIAYVPWRDPIEGAFTTEAPRGWKVTGGLYRFAPVDVRPEVEVGSPDGSVHIQFGDAKLTTFGLPGPSSQIRGLHEGQSYSANGVTYTVLHYLDGAEASKMYVNIKLAKEHSGLEITESKDLPELTEQVNNKSARGGIPTRNSVGATQFTYPDNGRTVHGFCMMTTTLMGSGNMGTWSANAVTVTAPADKLEMAKGIVKHMIDHTITDPQWNAEAQRTAQEFNQMVMVNHEHAMAQLRQQYEKAVARLDENHRVWTNIINGETDVRNPSTGETFKANAGSNYYWQRGSTVVGNNSGWAPGINFTKMQEF